MASQTNATTDAIASQPLLPIASTLKQITSLLHAHRSARTMWLTRKRQVQLEMTLHTLVVYLQDDASECIPAKRREIHWQDVLGAHLLTEDGEHLNLTTVEAVTAWRANLPAPPSRLLLGLFVCPSRQKHAQSLKKRRMMEWFYEFDPSELEHVVDVIQWINFMADPRTASTVDKVTTFQELTRVDYPRRRFLAIINPVGGSGRSVQMYETKVAPVFRYANIDVDVQLTERAAHGTEIMRNLPLNTYDCVFTVGGDGSLFEVFQGLMQRPDWNKAVRQVIGIIPGGSGNGLVTSVLHQSMEKPKPVNAAFVLAKGQAHDLDITAIRNGKDTIYSFLSFEWALIADVDIESEKFRAIGGMRFVVVFAQHLFFTRKNYSGTVLYLDDDGEDAPQRYFDVHDPESTERPSVELVDSSSTSATTTKGTWKELTGHFLLFWVMNTSHAATDSMVAPGAELDDGYNYILYLDGSCDRMELVRLLTTIENGAHVEKTNAKLIRTRAFKITSDKQDDLMCVDGELIEGPIIEGQVHRGLGQIMALPPRPTAMEIAPAH